MTETAFSENPSTEQDESYYGGREGERRHKDMVQTHTNKKRTKLSVAGVTKEFHRWKRTPAFAKWSRNQFLRQGGLCWYCQSPLWLSRQNVEHKTARSLGGQNNKNNLVLSCATCNKEKGSRALSSEERCLLNELNKNNKGTYRKNREYYDNLLEYSEESIMQKLSYL